MDKELSGLPAQLLEVLRDQSIVVPRDAAVFELIATWTKAPAVAASASVVDPTSPPWLDQIPQLDREARAATGGTC